MHVRTSLTRRVDRSFGTVLRRLIPAVVAAVVLAACQTSQPFDDVQEGAPVLSVAVDPSSHDSAHLEGQTVSGVVVISVLAEDWMHEVRFFVDGLLDRSVTEPPFDVEVDTTQMRDGVHLLGIAVLTSDNQVVVSQLVEFMVLNDPPAMPVVPDEPPPVPDEPPVVPDEPGPAPPAPGGRGVSLRGDAGFLISQLSGAQRTHYERLLQELNDPAKLRELERLASRDDIFEYGRGLGGHIRTVLTVFRVTGDLALLDHVDHLAELMRAELADGWRGTNDGTCGTSDGFLNWVYRYVDTPEMQGKDTRHIDEMQTHAIVAMFAYALDLNRDLVSPSGRNYGAHADFWKDYLVNHFEAKWRKRRNVPSGFPILTRTSTTVYHAWLSWHYYMGRLTGNGAYTREAERMSRYLTDDLRAVSVHGGEALVWARGLHSLGDSLGLSLQPTNYTSIVYAVNVDLHLEGFHDFAATRRIHGIARTFTHFVMDTSDPVRNGFARDIGGGVDRVGLAASATSWPRRSVDWFQGSQVPLIAAWDTSGDLVDVTQRAQASLPRSRDTSRLAAGLFLEASGPSLQMTLHSASMGNALTATRY